MSRDSTAKILSVAFLVCVICSIIVSAAAVGLKSRQQTNQEEEKKRNILQIARLYDPARPVEQQFRRLTPALVELASGSIHSGLKIKPASVIITPEADLAGIKQRSAVMEVYLEKDAGKLKQVILPVYGKGLWSTMYGFIALGPDLSTVVGFGFYQHGETPGLGGEIENPAWLKTWRGKTVYAHNGSVALSVVKPGKAASNYTIDGLSGATLTSRGVSNLIHYWLGENGYKPFLDGLRKAGAKPL